MIDVMFTVTVCHCLDPKKNKAFVRDVTMPALPPNLKETGFRVVPGPFDNQLEYVSLTWNQLRNCYVIDGSIKTSSEEQFAKIVAALLQREWTEEEDNLSETLL